MGLYKKSPKRKPPPKEKVISERGDIDKLIVLSLHPDIKVKFIDLAEEYGMTIKELAERMIVISSICPSLFSQMNSGFMKLYPKLKQELPKYDGKPIL